MSKTIDVTEVREVVHSAIVAWGATVADCSLPEGGSGPSFDTFAEVSKILRACDAAESFGAFSVRNHLSADDFAAINRLNPRVFDMSWWPPSEIGTTCSMHSFLRSLQ